MSLLPQPPSLTVPLTSVVHLWAYLGSSEDSENPNLMVISTSSVAGRAIRWFSGRKQWHCQVSVKSKGTKITPVEGSHQTTVISDLILPNQNQHKNAADLKLQVQWLWTRTHLQLPWKTICCSCLFFPSYSTSFLDWLRPGQRFEIENDGYSVQKVFFCWKQTSHSRNCEHQRSMCSQWQIDWEPSHLCQSLVRPQLFWHLVMLTLPRPRTKRVRSFLIIVLVELRRGWSLSSPLPTTTAICFSLVTGETNVRGGNV